MSDATADLVVIGAGIVGLATARAALRAHPEWTVEVLEAEDQVAAHQSGHNSGVLHAGLYYPPGSLKARLCRTGGEQLLAYASERGVPARVTGKLVVATRAEELAGLARLEERGRSNGLTVTRLGPDGVRDHEPHVAAVAGLHVAETGVADFAGVCRALADDISTSGGEIRLASPVAGLRAAGDGVIVETRAGAAIRASRVVNCAGLAADRVAAMSGTPPPVRIVAFRGEYAELRPEAAHLVRGLVYPVPDPDFPFLGVHLTRGVDGSVHAGPNAVPALSRHGYRWRDVSPRDIADALGYPGFRRLARRHLRQGGAEVWRSLSWPAFVRSVARLVPEITAADLVPAPSGVRAQALRPNGTLVDDFLVERHGPVLHVLNAPSPAATASLAIGEHLADLLDAPD